VNRRAQGSGSVALSVVGIVDALKERRADGTALAGTLDHKQPLVDAAGLVDQLGEMVQAGEHADVGGLVDHGLDPQRAVALEVLLDARALVAKVDPHTGAARDDPGGEPVALALGLAGGHDRDLFGAANRDVVGNQRFEEAPGATRRVEHQRARHLDLAHRQIPPIAGGAILAAQRRRNLGDPAVKERLARGAGRSCRRSPAGAPGPSSSRTHSQAPCSRSRPAARGA
jgi:hypothetical protein